MTDARTDRIRKSANRAMRRLLNGPYAPLMYRILYSSGVDAHDLVQQIIEDAIREGSRGGKP